jgi:hypothetical protein
VLNNRGRPPTLVCVIFQELLNQAKAETARVSRIAEDHMTVYRKKRDQEMDELSRLVPCNPITWLLRKRLRCVFYCVRMQHNE